jgi:Leucine-rich repeat (LRR) protein
MHDLNPGFDGKLTPVIDKAGVVTRLELRSDKVSDLSPIRALAGLRDLRCGGTPGKHTSMLVDLSPLRGLALIHLSCGHTKVSDLTPLKEMPLEVLSLRYSLVTDLTPLEGKKIANLNIQGCMVDDLTPLQGLPLVDLVITDVPDADFLQEIPTLKTINEKPVAEFLKEPDAKKP